uniref:eRF1/Pelota-like N-terminal domain-containing protein n=1 Tax=Glossina brevipalpis TaxID=37001 RepID=A0A1A9VZM9_9MUSC
MKLIDIAINKRGQGTVFLIPEESDDMRHAYNLIAKGDCIRGPTKRKVQKETATGSSFSNRVRTTVTIRVESIDFDTQTRILGLRGSNIVQNRYVKMGAYHTLYLEVKRIFGLRKRKWDTFHLDLMDVACFPTSPNKL